MKKGPMRAELVSITGKPVLPDVITQAELYELSALQGQVLIWQDAQHQLSAQIRERLRAGATIEPGRIRFDPRLGIARTIKENAG